MNINIKGIVETIIETIKINVSKGLDKLGNPLKAYSTNPFGMPSGAVYSYNKIKTMIKDGKANFYINKRTGGLWIRIDGYREYKIYMKPEDGGIVNMNLSGFMMSKIDLIEFQENNYEYEPTIAGMSGSWALPTYTLTFGFNNEIADKRASYNIRRGFDFFGIPMLQLHEIIKLNINK